MSQDPWWTQAACRDANPRLFDPVSGQGHGGKRFVRMYYAEAMRFCESCPVRRQCLEDALAHEPTIVGSDEPFRAGFTAKQLAQLREARRMNHVAR